MGVASSLGVDGVGGLDGPTVPWAYSMTQLIHTIVLSKPLKGAAHLQNNSHRGSAVSLTCLHCR